MQKPHLLAQCAAHVCMHVYHVYMCVHMGGAYTCMFLLSFLWLLLPSWCESVILVDRMQADEPHVAWRALIQPFGRQVRKRQAALETLL